MKSEIGREDFKKIIAFFYKEEKFKFSDIEIHPDKHRSIYSFIYGDGVYQIENIKRAGIKSCAEKDYFSSNTFILYLNAEEIYKSNQIDAPFFEDLFKKEMLSNEFKRMYKETCAFEERKKCLLGVLRDMKEEIK